MGAKNCAGCGAELRLRSAPCPLCGTDPDAVKPADWSESRKQKDAEPREVASYQSDLRKLRDELKRLREAEAS